MRTGCAGPHTRSVPQIIISELYQSSVKSNILAMLLWIVTFLLKFWRFSHQKRSINTTRYSRLVYLETGGVSRQSKRNFLQINSQYLKFLEGNLFEKTKKYFSKMAKLFVYGVNARCPRDVLEGEFARCGEVTDVYITEKVRLFFTFIF